jgi:hypothetical protein
MPACMRWRSMPRRRANEVPRDGQESGPNSLLGRRPVQGIILVAGRLAAARSAVTSAAGQRSIGTTSPPADMPFPKEHR